MFVDLLVRSVFVRICASSIAGSCVNRNWWIRLVMNTVSLPSTLEYVHQIPLSSSYLTGPGQFFSQFKPSFAPPPYLPPDIIQNFAFSNSDQYHPQTNPSELLKVSQGQPKSQLDICNTIKEEILLRLSTLSTPIMESKSLDASPDSKGIKRRLSYPSTLSSKRSCSDTNVNSTGSGSSGDGGNEWTAPTDTNSQLIWNYYRAQRQNSELFNRKLKLRDALFNTVQETFPYCGLYITGSSLNGFGSISSDMDLCLMLSVKEINQRREALEILHILQRSFRRLPFLTQVMLIRAKVPILKFTDRVSGVECDLNINNAVGIRNTHLLNMYANLDWRVKPLVLFIKHWAKSQNINEAKDGTLSSYALVLLVIHFLQAIQPPVLPPLQSKFPYLFSTSRDIRTLSLNESIPDFTSKNSLSLSELFIGFLNYYNKFDFNNHAISLRLGRQVRREEIESCAKDISEWKYICIEEPFNLSNTARSVYDIFMFKKIINIIQGCRLKIQMTNDIHKLFTEPL